jgi:hypothetical protein
MSTNFRNSLLFKAFLISMGLNGLMILAGTFADLFKPLALLGKLSNGIAAPPGFVLRQLVQPKQHSISGVIVAMVEGLFGSIVFYTVTAWIVLLLVSMLQPRGGRS